MPTSKKKPRYHTSRKYANEAVWVVDTRWNSFVNNEEHWNNWAPILETNINQQNNSFYTPRSNPKTAMKPRTLEDAIALAVIEQNRWHQRLAPKYQFQVRLRHTTNGDIIPAELFA